MTVNEKTVPNDFVHLFQDPLFLRAVFSSKHHQMLTDTACKGVRYSIGPFATEYYTGDIEPELVPYKGLRLIIWHRVIRDSIPPGWKQFPFESNRMVYSCVDIRDRDTFYLRWKKTFRYYNNCIVKNNEYRVEEATSSDYHALYTVHAREILSDDMIRVHVLLHGRHERLSRCRLRFLVLRCIATGDVVAGISTIDSMITKQSYYISAFTRKDIAPPFAGFWLCKTWMDRSSDAGIQYANLGTVWTHGQPKAWKGFSDFKMKFNPFFIVLKRELYRFTFSLR